MASKKSVATKPPSAVPGTKLDKIVALLRTPKGATLYALMRATGWQAHSVRGALAGALKKGRALTIISERVSGVRVYRVAA